MPFKYLHCGECWNILGEIPPEEPSRIFDTFDCSWECGCGRLNLSSHGTEIKYDSDEGKHYFYYVDGEEGSLVEKIPDSFEFNRDNFQRTREGILVWSVIKGWYFMPRGL